MAAELEPEVDEKSRVGWLEGRVFLAVAFVLWTATLAKCIFCVDDTFDSWWYHLPFAARLSGLVSKDSYIMSDWLESCYQGFPVLGEALQGLVWRLTGRIESANLVAGLSLLAFTIIWSRILKISASAFTVILFSVPLIQFHVTRCHVDLFSALLVSSFLAGLIWVSARGPVKIATLAAILISGALATNSKFFALPPVLAGHAFLFYLFCTRGSSGVARGGAARLLGVWLFCLTLTVAPFVRNYLSLGNPVYPVRITVLGYELPGTRKTEPEVPAYMRSLPRPIQWILSMSEIDWVIRHKLGSIGPYSVDMAALDDLQGTQRTYARTGGFFGPLVLGQVLLLAYLSRRIVKETPLKPRAHAETTAFLLALTLLASAGPQCIELRYSFFWILLVILANLIYLDLLGLRDRVRLVAGLHLAGLGFVLAWTHLGAFRPFAWSKGPFAGLLAYKQHYADPTTERFIEQTDSPVLLVGYSPRAFLYCDYFWSERKPHKLQAPEVMSEVSPSELEGSVVLQKP